MNHALSTDFPVKGASLGCWTLNVGRGAFTAALLASSAHLHAQSTGLVVGSTGNVGIGTTNPATALSIGTPAGADKIITLSSASNAYQNRSIFTNANGLNFGFSNSNGDPTQVFATMTLQAGGNVGIGTTTPVAHLEIGHNATNFIRFDGGGGSTKGNFLFEQSTDYSDSFPLVAFTTNDSNTARSNTLVRIHSNETGSGAIPFEVTSQGTLASPTYTALAVNYIGNVGIGTTGPQSKLHVYQSTVDAVGFVLQGNTINTDNLQHYIALTLDGDYGNATGNYSQIRSYSNLYNNWGSQLAFYTTTCTAANTLAERMRIDASGNVGIGTTSPQYMLDVAGQVHASSFVASSGNNYADFVFKPGYKLEPLSDVETSIKKDGHLPGIPSEAEAKAHGIDLASMQVKLLQKIEELTLHQIDQEKRLNEQSRDIEQLRNENAELREKVTK